MKSIALNLGKKTVLEKLSLGRNVVTSMTGNVNYTIPNPALADITTAINELETAYNNSLDGSRTSKAILREKVRNFDRVISNLANYVENIAGGDEVILMSSGMPLRKEKETIGMLEVPQDVKLSAGPGAGKLWLRFEKVKGASNYEIQIAYELPDLRLPESESEEARTQLQGINNADDYAGLNIPDFEWKNYDVTSKIKFLMSGLNRGRKIWVRVRALGAINSDWSDPATYIVV
ncbi:MAG: hypothetical protein KA792_09740 [Bacteroidales bacterium]|nr:hypothetical protein [Bacteroidales bacterium]